MSADPSNPSRIRRGRLPPWRRWHFPFETGEVCVKHERFKSVWLFIWNWFGSTLMISFSSDLILILTDSAVWLTFLLSGLVGKRGEQREPVLKEHHGYGAKMNVMLMCANVSVFRGEKRVEVTAAPVVSVEVDEPKHHSVPELFSASSSSWTTSDDKEPRQVLINGLSGDCRMQPAGSDGQQEPFGVTLIHTVTLTSDFTCASFNTRTNTYTLSGCTPLGLSFCP